MSIANTCHCRPSGGAAGPEIGSGALSQARQAHAVLAGAYRAVLRVHHRGHDRGRRLPTDWHAQPVNDLRMAGEIPGVSPQVRVGCAVSQSVLDGHCVDIADATNSEESVNDRKLRIDTRMRQLNGMGLKVRSR